MPTGAVYRNRGRRLDVLVSDERERRVIFGDVLPSCQPTMWDIENGRFCLLVEAGLRFGSVSRHRMVRETRCFAAAQRMTTGAALVMKKRMRAMECA